MFKVSFDERFEEADTLSKRALADWGRFRKF
jgi:hypothetical protein